MDHPGRAHDAATQRRSVFVRPGALALHRPGVPTGPGVPTSRRGPSPRDPDADRALNALHEFGFRVRVTDADGAPATIEAQDWLLTDSVEDCRWARRAKVRTVLVGGPSSAASMPERCDRSVSDVYRAALEVMMADPSPGHVGETSRP